MLITFTRRKSGKIYATPVNYVREGDTVLLTTDSPWRKNLRRKGGAEGGAGASVTLRIQDREVPGVAEALTQEVDVAEVLEKILREQPGYGKWVGIHLGPDGRVDREQVPKAVEKGRVAVRVRLESPEPGHNEER